MIEVLWWATFNCPFCEITIMYCPKKLSLSAMSNCALLVQSYIFNKYLCDICVDDFNRVVLSTLPEVKYSDYINASYVDVSMSIEVI